VKAGRPSFAFLFRHPAHLLALGFGTGLAPVAPGTFGTLVAIPLAWWLRGYGDVVFAGAIVAFFVMGVWAADVTSRHLGVADAGAIVWDEVVAFLLVLFFVGDDRVRVAIAFLAFRLFDILKPPPIRQLDATLKGGFGVMADDILAAGYALLLFAVWQRFFGGS
jgi:phosphatidylglycerophosphatase A